MNKAWRKKAEKRIAYWRQRAEYLERRNATLTELAEKGSRRSLSHELRAMRALRLVLFGKIRGEDTLAIVAAYAEAWGRGSYGEGRVPPHTLGSALTTALEREEYLAQCEGESLGDPSVTDRAFNEARKHVLVKHGGTLKKLAK